VPDSWSTRILTLFFHYLYNDFAWTYDLVASLVSMGLWKSWVFSIAEDINQPPILEVGFGPGHLMRKLQRQGLKVYGIDASYAMAKQSLSRKHQNSIGNCFVNGYAQYLPFADNSFRTIVATFPAEFILEEATWREFQRVLHSNGVVYWLPAAWITSASPFHRLAAWLFRITHQVPADEPGQATERFEMLEQLGFNINQEFRSLKNSVVWIVKATL
jgi:ubiquinone/menaquinone biosynthesis C-methylase UbiE